MGNNEEKKRRKAMAAKIAQEQKAKAEAAMPISRADLKALFDEVNDHLETDGCDHTLGTTRNFLRTRELPEDQIAQWLVQEGGGCDCEVIANVEETWGEAVGSI